MKNIKKLLSILILLSMTFITQLATFAQNEAYPEFNKTDSKTNINVHAKEGIYPKDAELFVNILHPDSAEYKKAISGLDSDKASYVQKINIYNISVQVNGNKVQLKEDQEVTIRIPAPYGFDKNEIEALNIIYGENNDIPVDGYMVEIDNKPYFEFTTHSLNNFEHIALIDKKSVGLTIFVFLVVSLIAIIIVVLAKKNKSKS